MNMTKKLFSFLYAVGLSVALLCGCATSTDKPVTPEQREARLNRAALVIKGLSRDLITYGHAKNPGATVSAATAVQTGLSRLIESGDAAPASVTDVIRSAGWDFSDNPELVLAIGSLATTYELLISEHVQGRAQGNATALRLLTALHDGIVAGLATLPQ